MKKHILGYLSIVLFALLSCDNSDEDVANVDYTWTISQFSPNNDFQIHNLKIGYDGELYASGLKQSNQIFTKLVNNEWQPLAEVDGAH